ncbi:MAG: hypothetical protein Q4A54_03595, partial [Parabacteroides sp.]|nr:hypothetical protein [Parabacteroides sp.]
VEDSKMLPSLRKVLSSIAGVSIEKVTKDSCSKKGSLDIAVDDVKAGRVTRVESIAELMEELEK